MHKVKHMSPISAFKSLHSFVHIRVMCATDTVSDRLWVESDCMVHNFNLVMDKGTLWHSADL